MKIAKIFERKYTDIAQNFQTFSFSIRGCKKLIIEILTKKRR